MKVTLQIPGKEMECRFIDTDMPVIPEIGEKIDIEGEEWLYVVFDKFYQFSKEGIFTGLYIAADTHHNT